MSDRDRLREIIDALPPQQVQALLTLLEPAQPIGDAEFLHRLAVAAEEESDETTATRVLAAEAEEGESVSHDEMQRQLGL